MLIATQPAALPAPEADISEPIKQCVIDHCWMMYKTGQISADHLAKEVFAEVHALLDGRTHNEFPNA
jgi:hypothetical protein